MKYLQRAARETVKVSGPSEGLWSRARLRWQQESVDPAAHFNP